MVDLRVLARCVALCALPLVSGCALGPIYAPRLEGRVTDARDGTPVAGALIVAFYTYQHAYNWDVRWTETDEVGRFVVPAHFAMIWGLRTFLADTGGPEILIAHPSYGDFVRSEDDREEWVGLQKLDLRIERKDWRSVEREASSTICGGFEGEACDEICRHMWGRTCDPAR